jgi:hypothetical protein
MLPVVVASAVPNLRELSHTRLSTQTPVVAVDAKSTRASACAARLAAPLDTTIWRCVDGQPRFTVATLRASRRAVLRSVAIARMASDSESPANVRVRDNRVPERRARALEVEVICSDQAEHRRRVRDPGSRAVTRDDRPWVRERIIIDAVSVSVDGRADHLCSYART